MGAFRSWSKEEMNLLRRLWPKAPKEEIIKSLVTPTRSYHAISEIARKAGIKRSVKHRKGDASNLLKETNEAYYWAGYLMADGYIHHKAEQIVLASALVDLEQMQKFASFIKAKAHIYDQKKSGFRSTDGKQVRVSLRHQNLITEFAKKFDFRHRKTYNPPNVKILTNILKMRNKFLSFFAGIIDGDGYINHKDNSIKLEWHNSWLNVMNFLLDKLSQLKLINSAHRGKINKRGYAEFRISIRSEKLPSLITNLDIPYLERKWSIYE